MSLIITSAPSSMQRFAVAKPMPVPAAAVSRTVLPASMSRGGGYGAAVLTSSPSLRRGARLAREAECALSDDVPLDLVRAGVDRVRAAEEVHLLQATQFIR